MREKLAEGSIASFRQSCARLFWADGIAGFLAGALLYPTWQKVLEPAQALAGLVHSPAWNPYYRYELGTWTLLNQLPAAALRLGISERAIAFTLSGLCAAVWFAAIALAVHAISRRPLIAFLSPFAFVAVRGCLIPGVTYPVMILGTEHTYGAVSLGFAILVLALFASNEPRWGAFAAALLPAIHPSIAFWLFIVLLIAATIEHRWARDVLAKWTWWGSGLAITILSFAVQRGFALPPIDAPESGIVASFLRYWDGHRHAFPLWSPATLEVVIGAILATLLLAEVRREDDDAGKRVLAIAAIAAAVIGFAGSALYFLPPGTVPRLLLALMPSRLVNIAVVLATPLTLALLARRGDGALTVTLGALLANVTLTASLHRWLTGTWLDRVVPGWPAIHQLWIAVGIEAAVAFALLATLLRGRRFLAVIGALTLATALALATQTSVHPEVFGRYSTARAIAMLLLIAIAALAFLAASRWERLRGSIPLPRVPRAATAVAFGVAVLVFLANAALAPHLPLTDRTNDPFWQTVAAHPGPLVTGTGLSNTQLRSRRPVLIDVNTLDYLPFTPGAGPGMDRILRTVYGIDLRQPPTGDEPLRALWEKRTAGEWRAVRAEFGTTQVLVRRDWRVQLQRVADGDGLALYDIEGVGPGR